MADDPRTSPSSAGVVARLRVMVNSATAYEHATFTATASHLTVEWPAAVLGLVPFRRDRLDVPLAEIDSIELVPVFFPARLFVAVAVAALVAAVRPSPWLAFPLALAAVVMVFLSYVAAVRIVRRGATHTVPVCWLQRRRVLRFLDEVRPLVASQTRW